MAGVIVAYCLAKPGAQETYPFGPSPMAAKVGGKMFALIGKNDGRLQLSLKCDPFIAASLREQYACITPGYHLNKKHWNTIAIDGSVSMQELEDMVDHSYELVLNGLPARVRASIQTGNPLES